MKRRCIVLCSLITLIVSCYPNTRWWDQPQLPESDERARPAREDIAQAAPAKDGEKEILRLHDVQTGIASFMADEINGRMTANGELYDMRQLTAAHLSLPFGAVVEVKNLANNKTVQVRINDRGPYVPGRIIDLSFQAAKELELVDRGSGKVEVRVIRLSR